MYLTELDPVTGLVKTKGPFDGVMAIKEFRDVITDPDLGVECFTAIALTADYLTPIKHYKEEDRPYKAMGNVCDGNRRAFEWKQPKIQEALIKYDNLQYNATIEEKRALDFMLSQKLEEIKNTQEDSEPFNLIPEATEDNIEELVKEHHGLEKLLKDDWENLSESQQKAFVRTANNRYIKKHNKEAKESYSEQINDKVLSLFKQLKTIKDLKEAFNRQTEGTDIYADGVVVNNYKLSRLEEKQLDKNSFYNKNR